MKNTSQERGKKEEKKTPKKSQKFTWSPIEIWNGVMKTPDKSYGK